MQGYTRRDCSPLFFWLGPPPALVGGRGGLARLVGPIGKGHQRQECHSATPLVSIAAASHCLGSKRLRLRIRVGKDDDETDGVSWQWPTGGVYGGEDAFRYAPSMGTMPSGVHRRWMSSSSALHGHRPPSTHPAYLSSPVFINIRNVNSLSGLTEYSDGT